MALFSRNKRAAKGIKASERKEIVASKPHESSRSQALTLRRTQMDSLNIDPIPVAQKIRTREHSTQDDTSVNNFYPSTEVQRNRYQHSPFSPSVRHNSLVATPKNPIHNLVSSSSASPTHQLQRMTSSTSLSWQSSTSRSTTSSDISIDSVIEKSEGIYSSTSGGSYTFRTGRGNAKIALINQRRMAFNYQTPRQYRISGKGGLSPGSSRESILPPTPEDNAEERIPPTASLAIRSEPLVMEKPYWSHSNKTIMAPYLKANLPIPKVPDLCRSSFSLFVHIWSTSLTLVFIQHIRVLDYVFSKAKSVSSGAHTFRKWVCFSPI